MKNGFSLVELSIVLVILGLLTGGILAGQNLIHAAELRSVTSQFTSLNTAIYTFRDKYFALPGDMTNAYDFWGAKVGCTDVLNSDSVPAGCNGNGDGEINDRVDSGEDLRAVQFLAEAGLIEGSYTGLVAATGNKRQIGVNIIPSRITNAGMWINNLAGGMAGRSGNVITFSKETGTYMGGAALTPEDQWNIDTKLDDGKPLMGRVTSSDGQTACHDGTDYLLTATTQSCTLIFWIGQY